MSRLLEFHQADEAVIVARILLQVHKAIDQNFPHVKQPSRKFAKTLFSENDEPTHNKILPTLVDGMPIIPPPPPLERNRHAFQEDAQPLSPPPVPLESSRRPPSAAAAVPPHDHLGEDTLASQGSAHFTTNPSVATHLSRAQGIGRYQQRRRMRTLALLVILLAAWGYLLYNQKNFLQSVVKSYIGKFQH